MSDRLTAYIGGARVGWFTHASGTKTVFTFDDAWRSRARRMELSLSMPVGHRRRTS